MDDDEAARPEDTSHLVERRTHLPRPEVLDDVEPMLPDWPGQRALAARLLPVLLDDAMHVATDEVGAGAANIGRLTSFVDPTGSTRRDYDAGGRVVAEIKTIGDDTYQIDWGFDVAGRVTSIRYPDVGGVREQVLQSYDGSGRVIAVGEYVAGAAYDARGNLTAATYGNGATVARSYSPTRGWMMGQTVTAMAC